MHPRWASFFVFLPPFFLNCPPFFEPGQLFSASVFFLHKFLPSGNTVLTWHALQLNITVTCRSLLIKGVCLMQCDRPLRRRVNLCRARVHSEPTCPTSVSRPLIRARNDCRKVTISLTRPELHDLLRGNSEHMLSEANNNSNRMTFQEVFGELRKASFQRALLRQPHQRQAPDQRLARLKALDRTFRARRLS